MLPIKSPNGKPDTTGPRRIRMNDVGALNQGTWLDKCDIVFIDPVGTGFSRATKLETARKLNGFMLISSILNFQTARFDKGNDLTLHPLRPHIYRRSVVSPEARPHLPESSQEHPERSPRFCRRQIRHRPNKRRSPQPRRALNHRHQDLPLHRSFQALHNPEQPAHRDRSIYEGVASRSRHHPRTARLAPDRHRW